jgi:subtilisin family serine protease
MAMEVDADGLADLFSNPDVISIQEDRPVPPTLATSTAIIGATQAWQAGYTGQGQTVAILDTGVENSHIFLSGKVVSEACYSTNNSSYTSTSLCPGGVEESSAPGSALNCESTIAGCDHGTHVAGIAAGKGASYSGVAKDSNIIAVQVFSRFEDPLYCGSRVPCVLSWRSDQIEGLERVLELSGTYDIAAVNMSLGGGRYSSTAECDAANSATKAAIDNLRSVGIATIISSGNNGYSDSLSSPGCISSAVSVGSTSSADTISPFSNEAPFLNLYAPGEFIFSSVLFSGFAPKSGTSMAAPHVTGTWAVLKQRAPLATVDEVLAALQSTGVPITSRTTTYTTPRIRVDLAVNNVSQPLVVLESPATNAAVVTPFALKGFAIDMGASSGSGVDLVEFTATPIGGSPQVLGQVTAFTRRTDVSAIYGAQFENSGFSFDVTSSLADGEYSFCAKARSTVTGLFEAEDCATIHIGPQPLMELEVPSSSAKIGRPFEFSGWAFDRAAPQGTGVDKVHIWAFPDDGGPIDWDAGTFMGSATYGATRTDISGLYGAQFESSGFSLTSYKRLPAGDYIFTAYAHSTLTGTFNNSQSVSATADPIIRVEIDTPLSRDRVTSPFDISGWAVDRDNPDNPGLDIVNVWAFPHGIPISFSTGTFIGRATVGLSRPDVATLLGNPNWENSGYVINVTKDLMPGDYRVRVFVKSTTTGTFDGIQKVNISVAATGTPDPAMEVEQPTAGATVTTPFLVNGYAVDLGANIGPGVDSVHIWAFPEGQLLNFGAGTFLGSATMGISNSTALSLYGAQFEHSGFELNVTKVLSSGNYTLIAFARSTITGTYNNRFDVEVTIP